MGQDLFSIFLLNPDDLKIPQLAQAWAAYSKIPMIDATMFMKQSWGFLGQNLADAQVVEIQSMFAAVGVKTLIKNQAQIVKLPEIKPVRLLDFTSHGIKAHVVRGIEQFSVDIEPQQLTLLAAGAIPETESKIVKIETGPTSGQKLATVGLYLSGIPLRVGGKTRTIERTEQTHELRLLLDMLLIEQPLRLRIDASQFDFSCLKERKVSAGLTNFRTLVLDLAQRLAPKRLNKGIKIYSQGLPLNQMGYETIHDFEKEQQWLLNI